MPGHGRMELGLSQELGLPCQSSGHGRPTSLHQYGVWRPEPPFDPESVLRGKGAERRIPREKLPLCESLRPGVLLAGERCWSKCSPVGQEDCMPRVLAALEEPDELQMVKRPKCSSHVECVGDVHRVVCEARLKGDEGESDIAESNISSVVTFGSLLPDLAPRRCALGRHNPIDSGRHFL
mmetsp:Transcript_106920/g.212329  ORF Transcript_106920/g.212329 Transcript_106920/m.212329 type:complete len:180 (-) Transcript_106920:148-687(-)|eukprot:CAMPEP_0172725058 /NCGR_PEP_ID=MMETSP1074-20121228/87467_1 /TAXON_ID=2916 /ORGANISM="Ceratium fusus, Strain PA161109" /LENGTH=179 /DNA_ID=CAMNT_0013551735 /DNA_START=103 /DNA_END=642 /DNA_ORIENTATION=+